MTLGQFMGNMLDLLLYVEIICDMGQISNAMYLNYKYIDSFNRFYQTSAKELLMAATCNLIRHKSIYRSTKVMTNSSNDVKNIMHFTTV